MFAGASSGGPFDRGGRIWGVGNMGRSISKWGSPNMSIQNKSSDWSTQVGEARRTCAAEPNVQTLESRPGRTWPGRLGPSITICYLEPATFQRSLEFLIPFNNCKHVVP